MPHRFICSVLDEMRECNKTRNYAVLLALIEEVQILANRMEAALGEKSDLESWHKKADEEKKEYKRLLKKQTNFERRPVKIKNKLHGTRKEI